MFFRNLFAEIRIHLFDSLFGPGDLFVIHIAHRDVEERPHPAGEFHGHLLFGARRPLNFILRGDGIEAQLGEELLSLFGQQEFDEGVGGLGMGSSLQNRHGFGGHIGIFGVNDT